MSDKYHLHVWIEARLPDGPLDTANILARVGRAIGTIGDQAVHVACEGPIREDHAR
jgi:hypothetical protein